MQSLKFYQGSQTNIFNYENDIKAFKTLLLGLIGHCGLVKAINISFFLSGNSDISIMSSDIVQLSLPSMLLIWEGFYFLMANILPNLKKES